MDPAAAPKPKLLISAWSLQLSAILLKVIGTGTPYWIYKDVLLTTTYIGLWLSCVQVLTVGSQCTSTTEISGMGWLKMIQAMMILSVMFTGAGFIFLTLKIWVLKDKKVLFHGALSCTFAGAFLTLVAVSRYADMKAILVSNTFSLSFSFAFCILGMILGCAAGVLLLVDRQRNKESWIDA